MSGPGPQLMSADTLNGNSVKNLKDEDLGKLEDIMIDVAHGEIAYGVVEFGGFLGIGTKYFAVPWSAFTLDTKEKCMRLDLTKERLDAKEGFDKDKWPNMADQKFAARTYDAYGQKHYWS